MADLHWTRGEDGEWVTTDGAWVIENHGAATWVLYEVYSDGSLAEVLTRFRLREAKASAERLRRRV